MAKDIVSTAELADWLGLPSERVRQLGKADVLPSEARNQWPLRDCVAAYLDFLRQGVPEDSDLNPTQERALLHKAQRERVEIENEESRGTLVPREVAESAAHEGVGLFMRYCDQLPERASAPLASMSDPVGIHAWLTEDLRLMRKELSEAFLNF